MISLRQVRQSVREVLINSNVLPVDDIAFEGRQFDPIDKELWAQEKIYIVGNYGVDDCAHEDLHIIANYNVFYKKGFGTEVLEDTAVNLINAFNIGDIIDLGNYKAVVHQKQARSLRDDEDFNFIPCQIYFTVAYSV